MAQWPVLMDSVAILTIWPEAISPWACDPPKTYLFTWEIEKGPLSSAGLLSKCLNTALMLSAKLGWLEH